MLRATNYPAPAANLLRLTEQLPTSQRRPVVDALVSLVNPDCVVTLFDLAALPRQARAEAASQLALLIDHDWTPEEVAALAIELQPLLMRF